MYSSPTPSSRVKHVVGSNSWNFCTWLPFNRIHRPGSPASKTLHSLFDLGPTEHKQGPHVPGATNCSRSLLNKRPSTSNPLKSRRCAPCYLFYTNPARHQSCPAACSRPLQEARTEGAQLAKEEVILKRHSASAPLRSWYLVTISYFSLLSQDILIFSYTSVTPRLMKSPSLRASHFAGRKGKEDLALECMSHFSSQADPSRISVISLCFTGTEVSQSSPSCWWSDCVHS